jgi:hypothetical protein
MVDVIFTFYRTSSTQHAEQITVSAVTSWML